MNDRMTKEQVIAMLLSKRAAWDALIARVPAFRLTEHGVAGQWSVKDIIAHITYYENWMADRLHEQLRGVVYVPAEIDTLDAAERDERIYQQHRDDRQEEALAQSQVAFGRLMEGAQAHSETFLAQPQRLAGAPEEMPMWEVLRSEVCERYELYMPAVEAWLAAHSAQEGGASNA